MAEAKTDILPFAAGALHTNALAASDDAARREGGADYYGLGQVILGIGRSCLTPGSRVVDLNCDIGTLMPLIAEHEDLCRFVVLSQTSERNWKCFDRLRTRVARGFVDAACLDLGERFPEISARMMIAIDAFADLTDGRRADVAEHMHRHLERGGVAIVVESVSEDLEESMPDPLRKKRRRWSATEWEAMFKEARFGSISRIWSEGDKVAWSIRR